MAHTDLSPEKIRALLKEARLPEYRATKDAEYGQELIEDESTQDPDGLLAELSGGRDMMDSLEREVVQMEVDSGVRYRPDGAHKEN